MSAQDDLPTATPDPAALRRALLARRGPDRASYAPVVPRLRRGLPAAGPDRRRRPRPVDGAWRGLLLDRRV